jgi:hypothetical protein
MEEYFVDINCTHMCFYQQDGKCNLRELPAFTNSTRAAHDIDCPYFSETYPTTSHLGPIA